MTSRSHAFASKHTNSDQHRRISQTARIERSPIAGDALFAAGVVIGAIVLIIVGIAFGGGDPQAVLLGP